MSAPKNDLVARRVKIADGFFVLHIETASLRKCDLTTPRTASSQQSGGAQLLYKKSCNSLATPYSSVHVAVARA